MAETEQITETADTPVADAPVADSQTTEDPFQALLKEFETGTSPSQASQPVDRNERDLAFAENLRAHTEALQIDARRSELQAQEQYLRAQEDARDEQEALKQIKGTLDIGDEEIRGFVLARVLKDASINEVWNNRRENPAAYSRMVEKFHGDLQHHVEQQRQKFESEAASADRELVVQSLRGQGGRAPAEPAPDFGRMSPDEFHQWKKSNMPGY